MRYLTFLSLMLMVISYGCVAEEGDKASRETTVLRLDSGALEEALEGYFPVPEGYLNAASIADIAAVRADELLVTVENHLSRNELDIVVKLMLDYTDIESRVVTVAPGEKAFAEFKLPVTVLDEHDIAVVIEPRKPEDLPPWESEIDFGQRDMAFEVGSYQKVSRVSFVPEADGSSLKWAGMPSILIESAEPESITAGIYTGWDDSHFILAVSVKDEKHFNTRTGSEIWNGDALQFAVDPAGDVPPFNLGLALASGSVRMHQWAGPDTGLIEKSEYNVARDDEEGETFYELKMPLEYLRIEPEKGVFFGFSAVVFDDDDGEGYDYWIQLTPGVAGGWDPGQFKRFILWE